jgi:hypothetical protein
MGILKQYYSRNIFFPHEWFTSKGGGSFNILLYQIHSLCIWWQHFSGTPKRKLALHSVRIPADRQLNELNEIRGLFK